MSSQREREGREKRGEPASRSAMRKHTLGRRPLLLVAVLGGGALGIWALMQPRTPAPHPAPIATDAMAESLLVADAGNDWDGALRWAHRLVVAEPANPTSALLLGVAWHNRSFMGSKYGRERSATRTSLERIEMESRALALIDSAVAGMRSNESWAEAMSYGGQVYETLGLPLEALQYYVAVRQRLPNYPAALPRAVFVEESLRDPRTIPSGWWTVKTPWAQGASAPGRRSPGEASRSTTTP
jgi:hypothetical protein